MRQQKRGQRARGFRIQLKREGQPTFTTLPTSWRGEKEGLPPEWEATRKNPQVVQARIFRTGKQIDTYKRV